MNNREPDKPGRLMLDGFWFLIYNWMIAPVLIILAHLGALFHPKVRAGVLGRYRTAGKIRRFGQQGSSQKAPLFLFHCASMGEFEHVKPLITALKEKDARCRIVVMFFSPSGYENVREFPGVDLFVYAPFDIWWPVYRMFRRLSPYALLISRHDVWPAQIWVARRLGIPVFLVNASLHADSGRLGFPMGLFNRRVYRHFTRILAVSPRDEERFRQWVDRDRVQVVGDTKYDQVLYRAQESRQKALLPEVIYRNRPVLVAGSTWPEDEEHLLPALVSVRQQVPDLLSIICPHEPTQEHLRRIEAVLQHHGVIRFSRLEHYRSQPFIVVDRIGILANLYSLAWVAYVGGSFKQNVHNVLEPAAYGIPVLFGPVHQHSHEAQLLKADGAAVEVHNAAEIAYWLKELLTNSNLRTGKGRRAREIARENSGATQKILQAVWNDLIHHYQRGALHP